MLPAQPRTSCAALAALRRDRVPVGGRDDAAGRSGGRAETPHGHTSIGGAFAVLPILLAAPVVLLKRAACAAVEDRSAPPGVRGAAMPRTRVAAFILDFRIGLTFKVALKAIGGRGGTQSL
jgi:hypothetical protein